MLLGSNRVRDELCSTPFLRLTLGHLSNSELAPPKGPWGTVAAGRPAWTID